MQMTEKISEQIDRSITTNKVIGNFIRVIDETYKDETHAREEILRALKNPSYIQNEVEKIKAKKIMEGEDIDDNQIFYNLMMVKTKPFFDISFESSLPVFTLKFVWKMWCCVHDEKGKSKVPLWFEKEVKKKFHYVIFKRIIKKSNLKIKAGNTCLELTSKFPVDYRAVTKDKLKAGDAYEYNFTDVTYQGLLSIHRKYDEERWLSINHDDIFFRGLHVANSTLESMRCIHLNFFVSQTLQEKFQKQLDRQLKIKDRYAVIKDNQITISLCIERPKDGNMDIENIRKHTILEVYIPYRSVCLENLEAPPKDPYSYQECLYINGPKDYFIDKLSYEKSLNDIFDYYCVNGILTADNVAKLFRDNDRRRCDTE